MDGNANIKQIIINYLNLQNNEIDNIILSHIKKDQDNIRLLRIEKFLRRWHRMNDREKIIETEKTCKETDREFGTNFWELEQKERFYLKKME